MVHKLRVFCLAAFVGLLVLGIGCNAVEVTFRSLGRGSSLIVAGVRQVMVGISNVINTINVGDLYYGGTSFTSYVIAMDNVEVTLRLFFYNTVHSLSGYCSARPVWNQVMRGQRLVDQFAEIYEAVAQEALNGLYGRIQAVAGSLEIYYNIHEPKGAPSSFTDSFGIKDSSYTTMFKPDEEHPNVSSHLDDDPPCWVYSICLIGGEDAALGSYLPAGASLVSGNGNYKLIMQKDCNLVLYDISDPGDYVAKWDTKTEGVAVGCYINLQMDGNLVMVDYTGVDVVWATNVYCHWKPNCFMTTALVVQDDGNLVIYNTDRRIPIWSAF